MNTCSFQRTNLITLWYKATRLAPMVSFNDIITILSCVYTRCYVLSKVELYIFITGVNIEVIKTWQVIKGYGLWNHLWSLIRLFSSYKNKCIINSPFIIQFWHNEKKMPHSKNSSAHTVKKFTDLQERLDCATGFGYGFVFYLFEHSELTW